MLELTADNVLDYLRRSDRLSDPAARVEPLSGGVSNLVLRIVTRQGPFVLKQSRPQLRTRDAWFSDLDRVYREQEVMQALYPLLPPLTVPEILFADRRNYVFAMSHAPLDAAVWKQQLLDGVVDLALGEYVGKVLGKMHEASARERDNFLAFADSNAFVQLRVDPFYRKIQERRPEVARPVADLIDQMLSRQEALCHGDYTPKNMLVHAQGFTLVDYETAYFGDPAMDLGLCLAHLLLKACRLPEKLAAFLQLANAFWMGYTSEVTFRPIAELQARGSAHLGACLLARIDGTSPVDYLPEENKREVVRRLARALLLEGPHIWHDVHTMMETHGAPS